MTHVVQLMLAIFYPGLSEQIMLCWVDLCVFNSFASLLLLFFYVWLIASIIINKYRELSVFSRNKYRDLFIELIAWGLVLASHCNLSYLENKMINEDNLLNVLGLDNHKTLNILGQERNDFWCPPNYISDWYNTGCFKIKYTIWNQSNFNCIIDTNLEQKPFKKADLKFCSWCIT